MSEWTVVERRGRKKDTSTSNQQGKGNQSNPRSRSRKQGQDNSRGKQTKDSDKQEKRKPAIAGSDDYDAHNATSRSFRFPSPLLDSFYEDEDALLATQKREDIPVSGSRVFSVGNFLSKEECAFLIETAERIGFDDWSDVNAEYPREYRNNERLIILSQDLADSLWQRVLRHLKANDVDDVAPLGWATDGTWLPVALNECFLFSRYREGSFFRPHYDGMYRNEHDECSIFTITVYLNDDYEGGKLLFRAETEEKDASKAEAAEKIIGRIKKRLEFNKSMRKSHPVVHTFIPKTGSALVFNHDTLHEGELVTKGTKYIFRTSIMFRHVEDLNDPSRPYLKDPLWRKTKEIFASFPKLAATRDPELFTSKFLEAQTLQLMHGRSLRNNSSHRQQILLLDKLPNEIFEMILQYLTPPTDFCQLFVCKRMKARMRSGYLWRKLYKGRWGEDTIGLLEASYKRKRSSPGSTTTTTTLKESEIDPELMDWYGLYRSRFSLERRHTPLAIYTADRSHVYCAASLDPKREPADDTITRYGAHVYLELAGWDCSFDTYHVVKGFGSRYFAYHRETGRLSINYTYLMEIWKHGIRKISGKAMLQQSNFLAVLVLHPSIFANARYVLRKGSTIVDQSLFITQRTFDTLVTKFQRSTGVPAMSFVSAELCALYSLNTTTGLVVFQIGLIWEESDRVMWRLLWVEDSCVVAETTLCTARRNTTDVIAAIQSLLKVIKDRDPIIAVSQTTEGNKDVEATRHHERIDADIAVVKDVVEALTGMGLTQVKEVTAEDITKGAHMYTRLPGFAESMICPSTYLSTKAPRQNKNPPNSKQLTRNRRPTYK